MASLHTEGSPTLRAFVLGYWTRDQCAGWGGGGGALTLIPSPSDPKELSQPWKLDSSSTQWPQAFAFTDFLLLLSTL